MPQSLQELDQKSRTEALKASFLAIMSLCAVKTGKVSRKLKTKLLKSNKLARRTGLYPPNTMLDIGHKKKNDKVVKKHEHEEWGDGGVWQKAILMGDKCQPLEFSGVIYYDSNGNQIEEAPMRSPRPSPLPVGCIKK